MEHTGRVEASDHLHIRLVVADNGTDPVSGFRISLSE